MVSDAVMKRTMLCILAAVLIPIVAKASSAEIAVIANPSVPVTHITSAQLLDLYAGDVKEWSNGAPVIVLDLKSKSVTKDTFYKYLGKSSSRMKSIWMKNMLSGEGQPPQAQETEQDVLEKVAKTPGAIGYVNRTLVTADVIELVVIPVQSE